MLKTTMVRTVLAAAACAASLSAHAIADAPKQINVPAGDLVTALESLAHQADISLVYQAKELAGMRTRGAHGNLTPQEAVTKLLEGTKLHIRVDATTGAMLIEPPLSTSYLSTARARAEDGAASRGVGEEPDRNKSTGDRFRLAQAEGNNSAQPPNAQSGQSNVQAGAPDAGNNSGGLNEIVVTAQRRSQFEQDVPITLTDINAEQLEQNDVRTLGDVSQLMSSVRIDYEGPFAQPTIRGVGTNFVATGTGSNVALYIDGFYSPNALSEDFELLNVQSVDVLKGPQGTLFGRNSTGGAILVTTSEPSKEPGGTVEVSYGSYNTQRYQAYLTGGFDALAFDLAGLYTKSNGFVDNIVTGGNDDGAYSNSAARFGAKAELSDTVSFVLRYYHASTDDPTAIVTNAYDLNGKPQVLGAIIPGTTVATSPNQVAESSPPVFTLKTDAVQLTGKFDFSFASLRSYSQYRKDTSFALQNEDFTSAPLFSVSYGAIDKVYTQELILTSETGQRLQWTAGAFYLDWTDRFPDTLGYIEGSPPGLVNMTYADTRSVAGFADATYEVVDNLFLTAGVRYTHDKVSNGSFVAGPLAGGPLQYSYPTLNSDKATPRAVLRYKLSDTSSVFASYTVGYKAALINMSGPPDVTIKPENLKSYETGYKYASRALSFDLSAYYYDYKDLQTAINNVGTNVYTNAADSQIYGLEGQVRYLLTPGLEFSATAAYLDAKYKSYPDAVSFYQCLAAACGAGYGSFLQTTVNASGFEMARAPKFSGNVSLRYTRDIGGGKFGLSGNLYHTSQFYFDTSQQFPQSSYSLLGLRAEWTDPSERFTLALYGDNVTDTHYVRQIQMNVFGIGAVWGPPATVNGSIRVRF
jgi:iron complex outermembrane receptor protein